MKVPVVRVSGLSALKSGVRGNASGGVLAYSRPRCSSGGACVFLMMPTVEVPTFAGLPRRREGEQLAPRYLDLERSSERDVHDDDEREKRLAGRDLDDDAQASVAR